MFYTNSGVTIEIATECMFYDSNGSNVTEFCPIRREVKPHPIENQIAASAPLPIRNELVSQCNALSDQIVKGFESVVLDSQTCRTRQQLVKVSLKSASPTLNAM